MRKTLNISDLVNNANSMLKHSADECADMRRGMMNLVETTLMGAGAYKGYRYLSPADMAESDMGSSFGINPAPVGVGVDPEDWDKFEGTDRTRVAYY